MRRISPSNFALRCLAGSVLALAALHGASAQQYEITLAAQPPQANRYGTASDTVTLFVRAGERATLAETRGSESRVSGAVGLFWVPVEQVPRDASVLSLAPVAREDDAVDVTVDLLRKRGDRQSNYSAVVSVLPGEWTRLYGPAESAGGARVYSTQTQRTEDSLYIFLVPR